MNINDYSKHRKLDVNSAMEKYLGEMASEASEEWNAPVFSEQHEKRGNVNIYRVDVLKYVFDRFYKYADIIYGDEEQMTPMRIQNGQGYTQIKKKIKYEKEGKQNAK